jgi:AcrR family transcriptional regulator
VARRSDHSREELRELILAEGHRQMSAVGFAQFSARSVAKAIGYTVGTIYNVFGSLDALVLAINARTVERWTIELRQRLKANSDKRLDALVSGYFDFAMANRQAWAAIYDFRPSADTSIPDWYVAIVGELTGTMRYEVRHALPDASPEHIAALSRSLLAVVHGHCVFALDGTFAQLGEDAPLDAALARVREAIACAASSR